MTTISPIEDIIADARAGRMVILVDDEDRENEGDLVMAARPVHARRHQLHGQARARADLPAHDGGARGRARAAHDGQSEPCVARDRLHHQHRGASRRDHRHQRRRPLPHGAHRGGPDARASDIVSPGHIFPLRARRVACCSARATPRAPWTWRASQGATAGRRHLRDHEGRRDHGPLPGPGGVRHRARPADPAASRT
jgi:hypothetical protein